MSLFKRSSTRASTAAGLPIEPIRQVWGTRYDSDFVGNDDGRHVEIDGWLLWADEETSERVEDLSHFPDICKRETKVPRGAQRPQIDGTSDASLNAGTWARRIAPVVCRTAASTPEGPQGPFGDSVTATELEIW